MSPAADGGVSLRGAVGAVRTESHRHHQAIHQGLHNQTRSNTMCFRNNKIDLSLNYSRLLKRGNVILKHFLAFGRKTITQEDGDFRLIFQLSSGGTLANGFIFLFNKRRGFFHSAFHGTSIVSVPNVKRFCTRMNATPRVSLTMCPSRKCTVLLPY